MAPDDDIPGFEDDFEDEAEPDEVLFGLEEEAKKEKKKRKGKKIDDELDELYEQEQEDPDEDIYANEEFEHFDPGVRD
jgi:hypothetical protein